MSEGKRVAPRVVAHVEKLRQAGLETESFFNALIAIRDDSALPNAHREALYRMVAMESYVWYLEALRGEPVDRLKLMQEAAKIAEKNDVAIKKRSAGDSSLELLAADIGATKKDAEAPPATPTTAAPEVKAAPRPAAKAPTPGARPAPPPPKKK